MIAENSFLHGNRTFRSFFSSSTFKQRVNETAGRTTRYLPPSSSDLGGTGSVLEEFSRLYSRQNTRQSNRDLGGKRSVLEDFFRLCLIEHSRSNRDLGGKRSVLEDFFRLCLR